MPWARGQGLCSMNKGGTEHPVRGLTHRQAHEAREAGHALPVSLPPCPRPRTPLAENHQALCSSCGSEPRPPDGCSASILLSRWREQCRGSHQGQPQPPKDKPGRWRHLPTSPWQSCPAAWGWGELEEEGAKARAWTTLLPLPPPLQARQPPEAATSAHCTPRDPHSHGGTGPLAPWLSQTTTWGGPASVSTLSLQVLMTPWGKGQDSSHCRLHAGCSQMR